MRIGKRGHHPPEVIAWDDNVAVINDDVLITSLRQHLREIADFSVEAKDFGAMDHPQVPFRKFLPQSFDQRERQFTRIVRSEKHFVLRIVEQAMAVERSVHVRIQPLQRLQNADRRSEIPVHPLA